MWLTSCNVGVSTKLSYKHMMKVTTTMTTTTTIISSISTRAIRISEQNSPRSFLKSINSDVKYNFKALYLHGCAQCDDLPSTFICGERLTQRERQTTRHAWGRGRTVVFLDKNNGRCWSGGIQIQETGEAAHGEKGLRRPVSVATPTQFR